MIYKKGVAQIVLMISFLVLAIALPVLSMVVKQNQDTRRKATGTECGKEGENCCLDSDKNFFCNVGLACTMVVTDDGSDGGGGGGGGGLPVIPPGGGGGGLPVVPPGGGGDIGKTLPRDPSLPIGPGDTWPATVPPGWGGGGLAPGDTWPATVPPGWPSDPIIQPGRPPGWPGGGVPPIVGPGDGAVVPVAPPKDEIDPPRPVVPPDESVLGTIIKAICVKASPSPTPTLPPLPSGPPCHPLIGCTPDCSCGLKTVPGADNEPCRRCGLLPPISPPSMTPVPTDVITSTPEPTKEPTDIPTGCKPCKKIADYNCDGDVNGLDYSWWKQEYVDKLKHDDKWEASHVCSETIGPEDFSAWRNNYLK